MQTKKIIAERKKELIAAGFSEMDLTHVDILEKIEQTTPLRWPEVLHYMKTTMQGTTSIEIVPTQTEATGVWNPNSALAAFQAKEKQIAEYKTKYSGVVISSLTDKENIKLAQEAKKVLRSERTGIEKERVAIKSPALQFGNTVDAAAKSLTAAIVETESIIDVELAKLDEWETAETNRKLAEEQEEINRRIQLLKDSGMTFDGQFYCIASRSMDKSSIQAMTVEQFAGLVGDVVSDKKRLDEQEAIRIKELKKERLQSRSNMLLSIGMGYVDNVYTSEYLDGVKVLISVLEDEPDDKFINLFSSLSTRISDAKRKVTEEAEKKAKERTVAIRSKLIIAAGLFRVDWIPNTTQTGFYFKNAFCECKLPMPEVETLSDSDFDNLLEAFEENIASAKIDELKKQDEDAAAALVAIEEKKKEDAKFEAERKEREEKAAADRVIFMERSSQLIELGLFMHDNYFWFKNEVGNSGIADIAEVKAIDSDNWSRVFTNITASVNQLKADAEIKRKEAISAAEALKPQLQKAKEYLTAILAITPPEITEPALSGIMRVLEVELLDATGKADVAIDRLKK